MTHPNYIEERKNSDFTIQIEEEFKEQSLYDSNAIRNFYRDPGSLYVDDRNSERKSDNKTNFIQYLRMKISKK